MSDIEQQSELGKKSQYDAFYNAEKLFAIPRSQKRHEIGIDPTRLPFFGFDIWNHFEVSWLNEKGKPLVATAQIVYDCASTHIVESKSLKLYFNSFNNTRFKNFEEVEHIVKRDLEACIGIPVCVKLFPLTAPVIALQTCFLGESIDELDVDCSIYQVNPDFLQTSDGIVSETLCSDLLRSNCLVTNQPDWGSVQIIYQGPKINRVGLLRYLVSYRDHNEFHEQCIERIFMDIQERCKPAALTVYGRYTRRGGLDINPYRSTDPSSWDDKNYRLIRQ